MATRSCHALKNKLLCVCMLQKMKHAQVFNLEEKLVQQCNMVEGAWHENCETPSDIGRARRVCEGEVVEWRSPLHPRNGRK
jgi:hypothetical protein